MLGAWLTSPRRAAARLPVRERTMAAAHAAARPVATLPPHCQPASRSFGLDRGQPIDRHYIDAFLSEFAADVRGRVLEVADRRYTRQFGRERVTRSEVVNLERGPGVNWAADLTRPRALPARRFDCFILTQTLQFVVDPPAALRSAMRTLRPGGVLLLTVPGISQVSKYDALRWGDYWRFTPQCIEHLLSTVAPRATMSVRAFGNVRTASALLEGLATHELQRETLNAVDPDFPVLVAARVAKP